MDARALNLDELREHTDAVRRLARRILRDDARADDVVQETWLMALRRPPRERARLGAWLGRVARNFALRARRDDRRRRRHEEATADRTSGPSPAAPSAAFSAAPSPGEILAREETRRFLIEAVLALPEPYRTTILLRYFEELPPRDIARRQEVPVETVRTRLKRALPLLRAALDARLGGPQERTHALAPLAGALAMGTKTKLVALTALLLAALATIWWTRPSPDRDRAAPARTNATRTDTKTGKDGDVPDKSTPATDPRNDAPKKTSPSVRVTGRVLFQGKPVAGAFVALHADGEVVEKVAATKSDGAFAFVMPGEYVTAAHAEHGPGRADVAGGHADVELTPGHGAQLRVMDARTKNPVAGAQVLLFYSGDDGRNVVVGSMIEKAMLAMSEEAPLASFSELLEYAGAFNSIVELAGVMDRETDLSVPTRITGPDGRVHLGGLLKGTFVALVRHPDYPVMRARGRTDETTIVRLEPGVTLTVETAPFQGRPRQGWVCELERPDIMPFLLAKTTLDEHGRAVFDRLRPGRYRVTVSRRGRWQISLTPRKSGQKGNLSIGLTAAKDTLGPRAIHMRADRNRTLHLKLSGYTIKGMIGGERDTNGWMVHLLREGELFRESNAGPDGAFSFDGIPSGRYGVMAISSAGLKASGEVAVDGGDTEVTLTAPAGELSGLVTGTDGKPLAGAVLYAVPREHSGRDPKSLTELLSYLAGQAESAEDGTFRIRGLPAGDLLLFCGHEGSLVRRELTLRDGEARRLDLAFTGLHRVAFELSRPAHVVVRDKDGGLLSALVIHDALFSPDRKPAPTAVFHLPAGRYFVDIIGAGFAPVRMLPLHVTGAQEVDLELKRGAAVEWKLHDGDAFLRNEPIVVRTAAGHAVAPGTTPFAVLIEKRPWRTDAEGRLKIPGLLPGRYTLEQDQKSIAVLRLRSGPDRRRVAVTSR